MTSHAIVPAGRLGQPSLRYRALARTVAVVAALVVLAVPVAPRAAEPVVVSPTGATYNDLAVAWWHALGQPAATNPLTDPSGANCANGSLDRCFSLPGRTALGTVTRTACTVSGQKELFFPMVNAFDVHVPGDGLDTPKKVYKDFQSFGFRADTLSATVDGAPVGNPNPATTPYRACAAPVAGCTPSSFSLTFPDDNLFGLPAGTYAPAVQDGYYLLLALLQPGRHTIKFGGTGNFGAPFSQDITYRLLVTPSNGETPSWHEKRHFGAPVRASARCWDRRAGAGRRAAGPPLGRACALRQFRDSAPNTTPASASATRARHEPGAERSFHADAGAGPAHIVRRRTPAARP